MLRVPLSIVSDAGVLQTGKAEQAVIQLSVDGAMFTTADLTVTEIGSGYYYVDIPDTDLVCTKNVLIRCSCDGCQDTTFEYTPDSGGGEGGGLTAADVWNYYDRALTASVDVTPDSINSIQSGLSHFDPSINTVTLGSKNIGSDKIATESYINNILINSEGGEPANPGLIIAAIQELSTKIDTLPKEIWGRESEDNTSRTLTSIVGLGIASEATVKGLIGQNTNFGNSLGIKDNNGNTTVSLTVTIDANNQIISIR